MSKKEHATEDVLACDKRIHELSLRIQHAKLMGESKRVAELTERLQRAQRKRERALKRV